MAVEITSRKEPYFIGFNRIINPVESQDDSSYIVEIPIRVDIREYDLLMLLEQLLLPLNGKINKFYPSFPEQLQTLANNGNNNLTFIKGNDKVAYSPMIEVLNTVENNIFSTIRTYVGVNNELKRVVAIEILPYNIPSKLAISNLLSSKQSSEFIDFTKIFINDIFTALDTELFTIHHEGETLSNGKSLAESVIDIGFIRDLQCTIAQQMNDQLLDEVADIDSKLKKIEMKVAKLMTLLKPTYKRTEVILPSPPPAISLNKYELILTSNYTISNTINNINTNTVASIREPRSEITRLILLRARKVYKDYLQQYKHDSSSSSSLSSHSVINPKSLEFQLVFLLREIVTALFAWRDIEYNNRIHRKIRCVRDRLEQLQSFRLQLILSLHDRYTIMNNNNISPSNQTASTGIGGMFWSVLSSIGNSSSAAANTVSASDRYFHTHTVLEKFPFLEYEIEPIIFDCHCVMNQIASGQIYVTIAHILCYGTNTSLTSSGNTNASSNNVNISSPTQALYLAAMTSKQQPSNVDPECNIADIDHDTSNATTNANTNNTTSNNNTWSLGSTMMFVIPLKTIACINILSDETITKEDENNNTTTTNIVYTAQYHSNSNTSTNSNTTMNLKGSILQIIDISGKVVYIRPTDNVTSDLAHRVFDLLDLLMKEKVYMICEKKKTIAPVITSTVTVTSANDRRELSQEEMQSIEEDMLLEVLSFNMNNNNNNSKTTPDKVIDDVVVNGLVDNLDDLEMVDDHTTTSNNVIGSSSNGELIDLLNDDTTTTATTNKDNTNSNVDASTSSYFASSSDNLIDLISFDTTTAITPQATSPINTDTSSINADAPVTSTTTTATSESTSSIKPKKNLAMNVQKFLDQTRKKA